MFLKDIIHKSYYATNGYIESSSSLDILEQYINFNLSVLLKFKNVIITTTYKTQDKSLIEANHNVWKKYFPDCILLDIEENRGHSFGIADSENQIVDYCKENNIDWICKSSNDVIMYESILDKEIEDTDFYYMNGIGYGGMVKYDFDLNRIMNEDFYPQTNFYFIDVSKIDFLYDKDYVNQTYNYIQSLSNYNGKVWEYIEGWSCENFLKQCVKRNNLKKYHIIPNEKYIQLLLIIREYNIHDSSHKNIMVDGICHFQFPDQQIIEI
jgi:hypothetical protein